MTPQVQQIVPIPADSCISTSEDEIPRKRKRTTGSVLKDQLFDLRLGKDDSEYFIPISSLKKIITKTSILNELCGTAASKLTPTEIEYIEEHSSKLFTILVMIGKPDSIVEFLREDISDKDLPFRRSSIGDKCLQHPLGTPLAVSSRWDVRDVDDFCRYQWTVNAPIFTNLQHANLERNVVLPFLELPAAYPTHQGGYSRVFPVRIHPDHHDFWEHNPQVRIKPLIWVFMC